MVALGSVQAVHLTNYVAAAVSPSAYSALSDNIASLLHVQGQPWFSIVCI